MTYTCVTCKRPTKQAPVIVEDRLYQPCCEECVMGNRWRGISVSRAAPEELAGALRGDPELALALVMANPRSADLSVESALVQWASEVLLEHRGVRERPEGCRAWGD